MEGDEPEKMGKIHFLHNAMSPNEDWYACTRTVAHSYPHQAASHPPGDRVQNFRCHLQIAKHPLRIRQAAVSLLV